jgi:hypothetical protein
LHLYIKGHITGFIEKCKRAITVKSYSAILNQIITPFSKTKF